MRSKKILLTTMCALCVTSVTYAVNIEKGANNTVTGSTEYTVIGNKLKMKKFRMEYYDRKRIRNGKCINGFICWCVQQS